MHFVLTRRFSRAGIFVFVLLLIEFFDELVFSAREAAWPLIQQDLGLTYTQIGLLFTLPHLFASLVEPIFGILADAGKLRVVLLGGGVAFVLALLGAAASESFFILLLATLALFPASGAFVNLAQIALMNTDHTRHEQNMARWTFAGSVGVVVGPLLLSAMLALGIGWRGALIVGAGAGLVLIACAWPFRFRNEYSEDEDEPELRLINGLRQAFVAVRRPDVLRWMVLLECSNLMLDILLAFLALYFVNVVGVLPEQAALGVAVWTGVGLVGDFLIIPLLERVRGLTYLRFSAAAVLVLYALFLLVQPFALKLVILGALGFFNAGWYSILQGQLYSTMPGRGGTIMAAGNFFGFIGGFVPLLLGIIAQGFGLTATMWLLLIGPVGLLVGLPRKPGGESSV